MLIVLVLTLIGFCCGSLPFSVWLGKLRGKSVLLVGDGNPGAANAFKAGGWSLGLPVLLLDFLKAAVPVGVGRWILGITGWSVVPIFLAPVVGHAFSPFLKFRGGKAIAATFGAWCGLTLWQGPVVLGLGLGFFWLVLTADAWCVMGGMFVLGGWWLMLGVERSVYLAWFLNLLVLAYKHRRELATMPRWRRRKTI